MQKRILFYAIVCLFSVAALSQTTTTFTQDKPIWDLRLDNATDMSAPDDGTSQVFNLGFDFTFFGETFNQAYMASNGCLIFGTLATGNNWEKNCTQYNPSPEPNTNYTMYPFWTDLIMGSNSSMLAKQFDDKVIFGWYEMWEYYRDSKNTFELWLYPNDSYEARYGELDIQNHDVFIGIQGKEDELETYYFHDECNTGGYNSTECFNYDWNSSSTNQDLEYDGSIFVGDVLDCSNPLNDTSCNGYWEAYDEQQCDLDPQYGPFCQGYRQDDDVAYYEEEPDYGYQEEDMWYDEEYDEWLDPNDPCYENRCEGFTDADWYALDTEQFGQEQVDEWFGADVQFTEDGTVEWDTTPMTSYDDVDVMMDDWDMQHDQQYQDEILLEEFLFQESFLVEDYREPATFIEFDTVEQLEEWFEEETEHHEERSEEEELAYAEEPEEEFLEELFEEEVVEEIFEAIEERMAEAEVEEERLEREEVVEEFEETFQEEFQVAERQEATGKSSISRDMALRVVASTITTAQASVSGTRSGNSVHATGGTTGASSSASSSSSGGMSTSNSPSMSAQFTSSTAQNNQVLDMSTSFSVSNSTSSVSVEAETVETTNVVVSVTPTQTLQSQIDVSVSTDASTTETEQTVANVIAQNLQAAQDDVATQQEETGEYGAEDTIIAYMGFVPDFNNYRLVTMPDQETWYEPKSIYANNMLGDNVEGFYQMAGQNLETLIKMRELQPPL